MTIFLVVLGIYIATLIYLNFKIKPDGKKVACGIGIRKKSDDGNWQADFSAFADAGFYHFMADWPVFVAFAWLRGSSLS